jgi:Ca2+-binding RTX toxin-like protein
VDTRRRVLGVAVAVVVLAGLPIARPAAQTDCDGGTAAPGPICATLAPPHTLYRLLDIDLDTDRNITWSATTVSCGNFYGSATGLDEDGIELDDETGVNAFWGHANGAPDNCSHNAPDHPGTIVADINSGETFSNLEKIHIPGIWWRCTYSGSAGGTGPACGPPPAVPICVSEKGNVAVSTDGASVEIRAEEDDLVIEFPESSEDGCAVPLLDVKTMTILGDGGDDNITVEMDSAIIDLFRNPAPGLGINLGDGLNELRLRMGASNDFLRAGSFRLPADFPGFDYGVSLDVNGDGEPDIGTINVGSLIVDFGAGDDRASIDALDRQLLGIVLDDPLISLDGGVGNDSMTVSPLPTDPAFIGNDLPVMRPSGQTAAGSVNINMDGGRGDSVDVSGLGFERVTATGSSAAETIVAAGGAGTGSALALPITILGKGGKDRLTGGDANDKLNGGPAADVCDGGKGRDTASKCETKKAIP